MYIVKEPVVYVNYSQVPPWVTLGEEMSPVIQLGVTLHNLMDTSLQT